MAEHLANDCLWEAKEHGITEADLLEAAGGDLKAYMLAELNGPAFTEGSPRFSQTSTVISTINLPAEGNWTRG